MAHLHIDKVSKHYGNQQVLHNIEIKVDVGEFLVLIGPSGCGKSTLLNSIAGLDSISEGDIQIGDTRVTHLSPKDRDIAMVFQSYALYPSMTVYGNIAFGMEMKKVPKEKIKSEVNRVAELLKIEHLLDRKPSALSGGQRQRVAMGRALAREPKIYLFDEPLSNLDAKLRVQMRTEIKKLHQRLGTTIVYVTHDQIEAMTLADRIAVLKDGKLQQLGTPGEIYSNPKNMFVAGFMGSPSINFIEAKVVSLDQESVGVEMIGSDGKGVFVPLPSSGPDLSSKVGEVIVMGIRPEHITESSEQGSVDISKSAIGHWHLRNAIDVIEPTGPDTLIFTQVNGQEVTGRMSAETTAAPGEYQNLRVDLTQSVFFDPKSEDRIY